MANQQQISKIRYKIDAIIDTIIARPDISQLELQRLFGYKSTASMSIIVNSDAFKERLAQRKAELVDPLIEANVEARLNAVANKASEKLLERLELGEAVSNKDLIQAIKVSTTSLGMGIKQAPTVQQNLYVIPAPAKPKDSLEWAQIVENETGEKV